MFMSNINFALLYTRKPQAFRRLFIHRRRPRHRNSVFYFTHYTMYPRAFNVFNQSEFFFGKNKNLISNRRKRNERSGGVVCGHQSEGNRKDGP